MAGAGVTGDDGVLGTDLRSNAKAVGEISKIGFGGVDHVILGLMNRRGL
jgi:L-cysteine desulfidase